MLIFVIAVLVLIIFILLALFYLDCRHSDDDIECEWLVVYNYSYGSHRKIIKAKGIRLTADLIHYFEYVIRESHPTAYIVNALLLGESKVINLD